MPRYRREDRAMRPIAYGIMGALKKICESLATPTANFPDILMDLFRSIRKKSCGSASADNRVRSPHTCAALPVCRRCRVTLGLPATTPAQLLEQGLFIATTLLGL